MGISKDMGISKGRGAKSCQQGGTLGSAVASI
jgi:hypothetical protein